MSKTVKMVDDAMGQNRRKVLMVFLVLGLVLSGCTTIPNTQFQAYHKAFNETRAQAENVLMDYAAAKQEQAALKAEAGASRADPRLGTKSLDEQMGLSFNVAKMKAEAKSLDAVAVRMQAWEIAEKYNEALACLAAGQRTAEISGAVDGFLTALKNFPVEDVAVVAADIVPYAGAVKPIIALVDKEVQARNFRSAVLQGAPVMTNFFALLNQDAELFWELRRTLATGRFKICKSEMVDSIVQFTNLVYSGKWGPESSVQEWAEEVNIWRTRFPGAALFGEIKPVVSEGHSLNPEQELHLKIAAEEVKAEARAAETEMEHLKNYHELMRAYVKLLAALELDMKELKSAVEKKQRALPSASEIQQVVGSVRQAYFIYSQSRTR